MNFQESQHNHSCKVIKLSFKEVIVSGFIINHPFLLNKILRSEKVKRYFIQLKTNILNL